MSDNKIAKKHTTNYVNTLIEVADDCPVISGEVPPVRKGKKSVANSQFELVSQHPYRYDSDEVVFRSFIAGRDLSDEEVEAEKEKFFSKGQACLRASPLTKRYGWGYIVMRKGRSLYLVSKPPNIESLHKTVTSKG